MFLRAQCHLLGFSWKNRTGIEGFVITIFIRNTLCLILFHLKAYTLTSLGITCIHTWGKLWVQGKNSAGGVTALADRLFQVRRLVSFGLFVLSEQARTQACKAALELCVLTGCALNPNIQYYLQNYITRVGTLGGGLGNIYWIICWKHEDRGVWGLRG
jgi:hypothetical protein